MLNNAKNHIRFDNTKKLLLLMIFIGFLLRIHNLDSQPIGYHDMKEIEYLSEAREFYFNEDYIHRRIAFSGMTSATGPGTFEEYAQVPIIPWMTVLAWKIFGIHIWIPRLIIVIFSLGNIALIYYLCNELTGKKDISIIASFLMTIMPLAVFFGRNVQPETPALFFILLSMYYYLKWAQNLLPRYIFGRFYRYKRSYGYSKIGNII